MATTPAIPNTDRIVSYSPVGSTSAFVVPWVVIADSEILAEDDLVVIVNGATLTSAQFSFSGNAITGLSGIWNGGTVTLTTAVSGVRVIIYSNRVPRRTGSFLEGNALPMTTLDKLTNDEIVQLRDLALRVSRSFKTSATDYYDSGDAVMSFGIGTLEAVVAAYLAGISPATAVAGWARTLATAKALYAAPVTLANGHAIWVDCRSTTGDGYHGMFAYDSSDAASVFTRDALGFVDNASRRWKRLYARPIVNPRWYDLKLDLVTDDTLPLNDLLSDAFTLKIEPFFDKMGSSGLNCKKFDLTNLSSITLRFSDGFPIHGINTVASDFVFGVGTGYAAAVMSQRITMHGQPWIYADAGTAYQDLVRFWGCTNSVLRFVCQDGPVIAELASVDLFFWNDVYLSFGTGSSIPLALPYGLACLNNNVNANNFYGGTCAGRVGALGVGLFMQGASNTFEMGDLSGWDYGVELSVINGCTLDCYFESNITGAIKIRNSTAALVKGLIVTGFATGAATAVNLIASVPGNTPFMQDLDFRGFLVKNYTNAFKLYGSQITNIDIPQPGSTVTNHVVWQDNSRPRNAPLANSQRPAMAKANLPAPSAGLEGLDAYCTDEAGGAVPVFCDGTNWRRVTDRAVVS